MSRSAIKAMGKREVLTPSGLEEIVGRPVDLLGWLGGKVDLEVGISERQAADDQASTR